MQSKMAILKNFGEKHCVFMFIYIFNSFSMGGYPDLNRELTVPHTVVLPIELYPPLYHK